MALVLPVFLTFVFGCMEFSRLSMIRSQTANAAYEGARFAMVQGSSVADARQAVDKGLGILGIKGATTTVRFQDEDRSPTTQGQATRINVQVDVPYGQNGYLSPFLPQSLYDATLTSQVTLRTNLHN
jgi:Flp pilus assembly protein TadG